MLFLVLEIILLLIKPFLLYLGTIIIEVATDGINQMPNYTYPTSKPSL